MDASAPGNNGPRRDDLHIGEITTALFSYPAVLVAHELRLFPSLAEAPKTLEEIGEQFGLRPRAAEALMSVVTAAGFTERRGEFYGLTGVSEDYLLDSSPTYWGHYLDYLIRNSQMFSYERIRDSLRQNRSQVHDGADLFEVNKTRTEEALQFTRWMHSVSTGPALAWPTQVDLSGGRRLLDVAGGSGAHAMGVARAWSHLHVTVFDMPPVCDVAREFITTEGLQDRITLCPGDMWVDPYPEADVHFYSQIFHDWPPGKCEYLCNKSYEALPSGGTMILHEMLFDDDKTGPLRVSSVALLMCLLYSGGKQYEPRELASFLTKAGFVDVRTKRTFGYWGIVTARKS